MNCAERTVESVAVLDLSGEIDLQSSPRLREILQIRAKAKTPALLLNLSGVSYLDSSGLATLIEYFQTSRAHQGRLALCCLTPRVRSVFQVARLDQIFAIHPDEAAALAALR